MLQSKLNLVHFQTIEYDAASEHQCPDCDSSPFCLMAFRKALVSQGQSRDALLVSQIKKLMDLI